SDPIYNCEDKARELLEKIRWPNSPVCLHCGSQNAHPLAGKSTRACLLKCRDCRKPFSVTVGTVFERSKIPLTKWLLATHLLASTKKGMSAHQLHRMLGVTYKTAWFMAHRIREAMKPTETPVMGSGGGIVEADETYIGKKKDAYKKLGRKPKAGWGHKHAVFLLVERGGKVRSMHIEGKMFDGVKEALKAVSKDAHLMTDEAKMYK